LIFDSLFFAKEILIDFVLSNRLNDLKTKTNDIFYMHSKSVTGMEVK